MISKLYIIYNPISTGPGQVNAENLKRQIEERAPHIETVLIATTHARHAIAIAKQHAEGPGSMIVSSSGDGGFHEVVNGVLGSAHPDTVVGLLPSGNANDHYHSRHYGDLVERIVKSDVRRVPVLRITRGTKTQYAHSYVGVGLTAQIGQQLNQNQLNRWKEIAIVTSGMIGRRGVRLIKAGRRRHYDSLVYAISGQMSKYIKTGADQVSDKRMAVIATPRRSLGWLVSHLLRRTLPPDEPPSAESAKFTTTHKTAMQFDGEIVDLAPGTSVEVSVENILDEII